MSLEPLKSDDLNRRVQLSIKEYIVTSGMKSGDSIPTEMVLSDRLGISRTAIREGLKGLEALGIIEVRPGVGRFLRDFNFASILDNLSYSLEMTPNGFRELLEVRIALESTFLTRDIHKFTAEDITLLRDIVGEMEREARSGDDEKELIRIHTSFHLELYRHADNSLLKDLIGIFSTVQRNLNNMNRYHTEDREEFINGHKRLVDAIEKGDPELAHTRLMEHFAEALQWSEQVSAQKVIP